jgi:hypothetical protein
MELGKEVARRQQMGVLPALDKWPQARQELTTAWKAVRAKHPADYTPMQLARGVLLAVEVGGFFVVGI